MSDLFKKQRTLETFLNRKLDDFANAISSQMAGMTLEEYIDNHELLLRNIGKVREIVEAVEVRDLEEYKKAREIKSVLGSAFCYAFNNNKDYKVVGELESEIGKKMYKFVRAYKRATGDLKALAKYATSQARYYYSREDREKIIETLVSNGMVFKEKIQTAGGKDDYRFFVRGLNLAVGDNCFGVTKSGKEYRLYRKCCVLQAIGIRSRFKPELMSRIDRIEDLPEEYETFWSGDYKGGVRVYPTAKEREVILTRYLERR